MPLKFKIGRGKGNCDYIPELSEVIQYQYDKDNDLWDIRIGDGKTHLKDLPPLANYDIYERVARLEQEIDQIKNNTKKINKYTNPLDYLIECCETAISTGHWKLDKLTILNAKDELNRIRQSKKDLAQELFKANQEIADMLDEENGK